MYKKTDWFWKSGLVAYYERPQAANSNETVPYQEYKTDILLYPDILPSYFPKYAERST